MSEASPTIGITGCDGFLGWHTRCRLHSMGIETPALANRAVFADEALLDAFVDSCDSIIHIAGVNRASSDSEVAEGNIGLANMLAESMKRTGSSPALVYSNSTKSSEPGPYGESKAAAAQILAGAAADAGSSFDDVVLPHLYGEYGLPFYNSAVHTFAHQIVQGETSSVDNNSQLELLHAQDASDTLIGLALEPQGGEHRVIGQAISVSGVLERLENLAEPYLERGAVPVVDNGLDLGLFNLVRSLLTPSGYPIPFTVHTDPRGGFYEVLRSFGQGQTSISTTVPGITRGDHYHLDKIERFVVVAGEATIRLRRLFHDEVWSFEVSGSQPVAIDMPPLTTHNITNTGDSELVTLFWSNDHFNPDVPDTFAEPVE